MSARVQKGGSAGEVWDTADNDASGSGRAGCRCALLEIPPPTHTPSATTRPAKLRDRWVRPFIWASEKAAEIKPFLAATDEICLKQGRSCKAALGNTSISFSKLLFSHAGGVGGKSLQVKCNHPAVGFALSGIIIILGWVPGIANIKLVI